MTLQELTDYWQTLCLSHKDVKQFLIGSWYDAANNTDDKYPLCFYELPYTINYNPVWQKPIDTLQFSLSVFLSSKIDSIKDDNEAISYSKSIGDAIITKAQNEATGFKIQSVNAVSVREYTDDNVAGLRYDITILLPRDICDNDLNEYFN